jgi:hypothetical protein
MRLYAMALVLSGCIFDNGPKTVTMMKLSKDGTPCGVWYIEGMELSEAEVKRGEKCCRSSGGRLVGWSAESGSSDGYPLCEF